MIPLERVRVARFPRIFLASLITLLLIICFLLYQKHHSLPKSTPKIQWMVDGPTFKPSNSFTTEEFIRRRLDKSEKLWEKDVKLRNEIERRGYLGNDQPGIIWDSFNPSYNCPHQLERIGRFGAGGKWVCGLDHFGINNKQGRNCAVFSFGIADETTFEHEILRRTNCLVYGFDHTIEQNTVAIQSILRSHPSRTHFNKIGIGATDSKTLWTLKTAMTIHNIEFIDILKVDVEASEYGAFRTILEDFPNGLPFGQLLIEIHVGREWGMSSHVEFKKWWESLEAAGLRAYNKEVNVLGPMFCCFEVAFLNVKVDHRILHGLWETN